MLYRDWWWQSRLRSKIESVEGDVNDLQEAVNTLGEKTAADIKYNTGSNETIKEHVDAIDQGLVKSVNEITPDSSGNIDLERVPLADNLYTEDAQQVDVLDQKLILVRDRHFIAGVTHVYTEPV